jgi:amino acid transporter
VTVAIVLLAVIVALAGTGKSALDMYGAAAGVAFYGLLLLLLLTSVAIFVYFRQRRAEASVWARVAAPVIAAAGIGFAVVTASRNIKLLIVASPLVVWVLLGVAYLVIAVGIVAALILKRRGSPTYNRIGRSVE